MMIDTLLDMTMGMMLGMVASPLMMKGIKVIRQRRKVNRILSEISHERRNYVSEVRSGNTQKES
jgi:ribosomal protein S17